MSFNFVMFQDEKNREMIMIPFPNGGLAASDLYCFYQALLYVY